MTVLETATKRKTARKYKDTPVSEEDINYILETARQAPSGSNAQPWRFIVVSDQSQKQKIREAAEKGEQVFYESISPERKKGYNEKGLSPSKPVLTQAPILIMFLGPCWVEASPKWFGAVWFCRRRWRPPGPRWSLHLHAGIFRAGPGRLHNAHPDL